jgi:hypothetical protein
MLNNAVIIELPPVLIRDESGISRILELLERTTLLVVRMTHEQTLRARQKLLDRLHLTGEILRGSLLERRVFRHKANCEKCASGEGHSMPSPSPIPAAARANSA